MVGQLLKETAILSDVPAELAHPIAQRVALRARRADGYRLFAVEPLLDGLGEGMVDARGSAGRARRRLVVLHGVVEVSRAHDIDAVVDEVAPMLHGELGGDADGTGPRAKLARL